VKTVAPMATVTASLPTSPSSWTIGNPSSEGRHAESKRAVADAEELVEVDLQAREEHEQQLSQVREEVRHLAVLHRDAQATGA
jgi:hypothetical protein